MRPIVLRPGEGDAVTLMGNTLVFKAEAADTGGSFGLVEYTAVPGFAGPPLHVHRETIDVFIVLEGELALRLGDETVPAPAGSFVLVPPGTAHTFSNPGTEPARFLGLQTPGGFEQYFRDLAQVLGEGPPDSDELARLLAGYDFELV